MRKRHGIRPSLSGFYHEKIYDETAKKNAELAKIRHARVAIWSKTWTCGLWAPTCLIQGP